MHYWAGRHLKDDFANTMEDVTNVILKVRRRTLKPEIPQFMRKA